MATNKIQEGDALTIAAPTGGVVSGTPVRVLDLIGVPVTTQSVGVAVALDMEGGYNLPKSGSTGPVFAVGSPVFWTGALCTTDSGYPRIGTAIAAAGTSATSVDVLISSAATARPFGRMTAAGTQLNTQLTALAAHADTLTIPVGTLRDGDVVKLAALVKVDDNNSTNTLATTLRFGGNAVAAQAAHDVDDDDVIRLESTIYIQTAGASGELHFFGLGQVQDDTLDVSGSCDASVNMSGALVIDVTATWSGAHADNKTTVKGLTWEVIR